MKPRHRSPALDSTSSRAPSSHRGDGHGAGGEAGDPATRQRILEATIALVTAEPRGESTMADVARKARVSRQALYLHFADRATLFAAALRFADDQHGVAAALQRVAEAPTAVDGVLEMVSMQARLNPALWPVAHAFEGIRRQDAVAERAWQHRLDHQLKTCRTAIERLAREGTLRPGLALDLAADLLWTLTSLRTWEDLVLHRKWSADEYERRLGRVVLTSLTDTAAIVLQRR